MRFTRLLPSFAAVGAMSVMFLAACSSDDNKSSATGTTAGTAGSAGANVGAKAGNPATNPPGSSGSAGKPITASAGAPVVSPGGAGAPNAGSPVVIPPVSGGAAGAPVVVPPVAGAPVVVPPVAGGPNTASGGAPTTGGTTARPAGAGGAPIGTAGAPPSTAGAPPAAGGAPPAAGSLDDVVGALCDWEFKCCSAGEALWELGPTVANSADCKTRFTYELRTGTTTKSPYPGNSSNVTPLLVQLGYSVNLANVTENAAGIGACVAQWKSQPCNVLQPVPTVTAHCSPATGTATVACALSNLVKPKLTAGQICDFALTEKTENDIECVAGTTCLNVGDPDNANPNYPTCVSRGVVSAPCTLDKDCDFGLYCSTTTGKCTEKGSAGADCAYKKPTELVANELSAPCKPGLTCNPNTLKCVAACSTDSVCTSDIECPTGQSCLPGIVANAKDPKSFKFCGAVGTTAGAKCDSRDDCATNLYCDGQACQPRISAATPACSTAAVSKDSCVETMYCKAAAGETTGVCTVYKDLGDLCDQATGTTTSVECNPTDAKAGCVAKGDGSAPVCSVKLLDNGKKCGADWDCQSGKCEIAAAGATDKTCIAGGTAGAKCDTNTADADGIRCAPGFYCDTNSKCVAQVAAGASCTSASDTADGQVCKAGTAACMDTSWSPAFTTKFICSDAPVPVANGGPGLACVGNAK